MAHCTFNIRCAHLQFCIEHTIYNNNSGYIIIIGRYNNNAYDIMDENESIYNIIVLISYIYVLKYYCSVKNHVVENIRILYLILYTLSPEM